MTNADIPYMISDTLMGISDNPLIILLLINIVLLVVGIFMDMTPAVLIFTPIFLPIAQELGMDPVHFGIMMVANLCIGLLTPPVGSALFVGCSISGVKIQQLIKPLLPFYAALLVALMMIVYIPQISVYSTDAGVDVNTKSNYLWRMPQRYGRGIFYAINTD